MSWTVSSVTGGSGVLDSLNGSNSSKKATGAIRSRISGSRHSEGSVLAGTSVPYSLGLSVENDRFPVLRQRVIHRSGPLEKSSDDFSPADARRLPN